MEIREDTYSKYYKSISMIGSGNFGKVILAQNKQTAQVYAIKQIDFPKQKQNESYEKYNDQLNKFFKSINDEVESLKRLSSFEKGCHENIVCYYDIFKDTSFDTVYIVTEYIPGIGLNKFFDIIQKGSKELYMNNLLYVITEILKAIEYINSYNIVHGDIKPDNIMLYFPDPKYIPNNLNNLIYSKDNKIYHVVLIDFGLSCQLLNGSCLQSGGTPIYVSPEVSKSKKMYITSDIWSLGVILFEYLNGINFMKYLFEIYNYDIFFILNNIKQSDIPISNSGYPLLDNLIQHMLKINPEERYTASQLLNYISVNK